MRTRKDGEFKWIAHVRDHFSRFSWARVLTDKCAAKVAVFLFDIFTVFGPPIFLQSDNGREFTADVINNLTKLWPNLKIIHGKPRRPQTQGSVERANYILKDKLGKWLEDRQNENEDLCWTVGLATIVYSMNLSVCRATKKRPFELVFGHEPRGHCVLIDQLWSQGIRYEENIPDDVQIEDDIQFDDDEDSVQTEYYDDEFNENLIQNLSQSENNDRDSMSFIMASI